MTTELDSIRDLYATAALPDSQPAADAILPEQFEQRKLLWKTGERQLLAALLRDAAVCFTSGAAGSSRLKSRLSAEAEEWIMARDDTSAFSFENICHFLDLEPDAVRQRLEHSRHAGHIERTSRRRSRGTTSRYDTRTCAA